jgi:phosphoglycerate dehydrogenase-like enzyme
MAGTSKALVLSCPLPRSLELIFHAEQEARLRAEYEVVETSDETLAGLPDAVLGRAKYIIGQPPLSSETLARLKNLKCVFNVESNLMQNMPYDEAFARGIHVVTTGQVFAEPVTEIGLGFAIALARDIVEADVAFGSGDELWGGDGNVNAHLLSGSDVGIVGFGDLGKALLRLLAGFRAKVRIHDPWMPASTIREHGAESASLADILTKSETVFVVAAVTSENENFLGREAFASMRKGAAFILLSRAGVVDFDALMDAVESGHIVAASDVFPEEPLALEHRVRGLKGFIRSAHRAGALDIAFKRMGDMVLEDMALLEKGLPPMRCKRAERETVARMRSKPVARN